MSSGVGVQVFLESESGVLNFSNPGVGVRVPQQRSGCRIPDAYLVEPPNQAKTLQTVSLPVCSATA